MGHGWLNRATCLQFTDTTWYVAQCGWVGLPTGQVAGVGGRCVGWREEVTTALGEWIALEGARADRLAGSGSVGRLGAVSLASTWWIYAGPI